MSDLRLSRQEGLMITYMPILKGREGELRAVAHISSALVGQLLPIFEVVPATNNPTTDAYRFSRKVRKSVPPGLTVAVDLRHLAETDDGPLRPMRDIADDLANWQIPMLPVLHLDDGPARLADIRYAAEVHDGSAILRLGDDTRDPDDVETEAALDRLRDHGGLEVEQCHLVLDVFEVTSERDVTRVEPVVRKCASWAQRYPWSSVTVAAGAMPRSLSRLPTRAPTPIPRWDLCLWRRVAGLDIQYADYGVAHPGISDANRRPVPSLRYTDDEVWWIYRWPQAAGDEPAMYDLCKALVGSDHWSAEERTCWGDQEIAARAEGVNVGPGNPTSWRAWTTSHHLARVVDQLTRSGHADCGSEP